MYIVIDNGYMIKREHLHFKYFHINSFLFQDEDINIKMKELATPDRLQQVLEAYPMELSLALIVFAIVILIGIVGLGGVENEFSI